MVCALLVCFFVSCASCAMAGSIMEAGHPHTMSSHGGQSADNVPWNWDAVSKPDSQEMHNGYFTEAVGAYGVAAIANTFVRDDGQLDHMVYCSETVSMSSNLISKIFAEPIALRMFQQHRAQGDMVIEWESGTRNAAEIQQQQPSQWVSMLPLACASRSTWVVQDEASNVPGDSWQMTFPAGLLFPDSPHVTLVQRLGKAYYFSRGIGYLRWASAIATSVLKTIAAHRYSTMNFADLACGAGWLGSTIAKAIPDVRVYFADADENVFPEVRLNIRANGLETRSSFHVGDLFSAYQDSLKGSFDHILFYPPQSDAKKGAANQCLDRAGCVMPDVAYFSPSEVYFFKRFSKNYRQWLRPSGGSLWLGVDHHLVPQVWDMFQNQRGNTVHAVGFAGAPAALLLVHVGSRPTHEMSEL